MDDRKLHKVTLRCGVLFRDEVVDVHSSDKEEAVRIAKQNKPYHSVVSVETEEEYESET